MPKWTNLGKKGTPPSRPIFDPVGHQGLLEGARTLKKRVLPIGFIVVQRIRIAVTHKDLEYISFRKDIRCLGKIQRNRKK